MRLPRILRRSDEESSTARRIGCAVQIVALTSLVGLLVTYLHARSLVLYGPPDQPYEKLEEMAFLRRIGVFLSGHQRPRPANLRTPAELDLMFRRVEISGENQGQRLEAWFLPHDHPEGLALVFHDSGQAKADLLPVAVEFHDLRMAVLMPDLRASGESEGQETSYGWHEALDVQRVATRANDYQPAGGLRVLYGLGSGGAAVMRAVAELDVTADALVLEGVFADVLDVFAGRIGDTGMIRWPTARISRFWVGYSMGFSARDLKPAVFAAKIKVPTLLLVGEGDTEGVRMGAHEAAARRIAEVLQGPKDVRIVPGGRPTASDKPEEWYDAVQTFLATVPPPVAPTTDAAPVGPLPDVGPELESEE